MILSGLYTCDLVCWGAAAPPLFAGFLGWLGRKHGSQVVSFAHRAKGAWEGTRPVAELADGREVSGSDASLWQRLWYGRLLRPSCNRCGFHSTVRPGDVSIGDYWGLAGAHPGLTFGNGTSCLAVNDETGADLVRACGAGLRLVPSEMGLCANEAQPMLLRPPEPSGDRDAFWSSYYAGGFEAAARGVGAIARGSALGLVKRAATRALRPLLAKEKDGAEHGPDEGWEVAMKADEIETDKDAKYPLVFAAKNASDEVRSRSASGGMYHALASAVIGQGGVVYGCAFDGELRAVHVRCETMAEAERCMGSKYSQSRMGDAIKQVRADLEGGRTVLFTGTPCQVAAVRACCGNVGGMLILADIICHGTPSPGLFQLQLGYIADERKSPVVSYEHRPKSMGWGHHERFVLKDGRSEQNTLLADSWRELFYDNRMLRPSCYRCPYTSLRRESDVTIADFWKIEQSSRPELRDQLGVSLMLVNTERGERIVHELDEDSSIRAWTMTIAEALPGNPMLQRPSVYQGDRSKPWEALYHNGYARMMREAGYCEGTLHNVCRRAYGKAKRAVKRLLGRGGAR